ncbi:MAG: hypothetical protein ACRCTY_08870, partial [Candidatus Adiutrix sp.]
LGDLENQKHELVLSLKKAQQNVQHEIDEKKQLSSQIIDLNQLNQDLSPVLTVMATALWRNQKQLKTNQVALTSLESQLKLEGDTRAANIRIQAAARELDLLDRLQSERLRLEGAIADKQNRLETLELENNRLQQVNEDFVGRISHLDTRTLKLRKALSLLKNRYEAKFGQHALSESQWPDLIKRPQEFVNRQTGHLENIAPLVEQFLAVAKNSLASETKPEFLSIIEAQYEALKNDLAQGAPISTELSTLNTRGEKNVNAHEPLVLFLANAFVANVSELAVAHETKEILEKSLSARESELVEVRGEAYHLATEKEEFTKIIGAQSSEISALKKELAQSDSDLAEQDGRLEASWAALNYLGTKASDAISKMKVSLEAQTREADSLSRQLKLRNEQIKNLETRQDQLALLYWIFLANTGDKSAAKPTSISLSATPAETHESLPLSKDLGGPGLGHQILTSAKKVARRSLFTLFLTGGLVMAQAQVGHGALSPVNTKMVWDALLPETAPQLLTQMDSAYLGRPVSLAFIKPNERCLGRRAIEAQVAKKVEDLATLWDLPPKELLHLLRFSKTPAKSVHLSDFESRQGAFSLLNSHFPKIMEYLHGGPLQSVSNSKITGLLRAAFTLKPYEGEFWERLYF